VAEGHPAPSSSNNSAAKSLGRATRLAGAIEREITFRGAIRFRKDVVFGGHDVRANNNVMSSAFARSLCCRRWAAEPSDASLSEEEE
ncbi:MAG: hypothetical protein AAFV29_15035, partial [Myxococcota bacterium]